MQYLVIDLMFKELFSDLGAAKASVEARISARNAEIEDDIEFITWQDPDQVGIFEVIVGCRAHTRWSGFVSAPVYIIGTQA